MTNSAQMVLDLKATDEAVRAKGWVSPGLGVPGQPLSMLGSTLNPLGGLAAAGLGWFMPLVSFLGDGLTQLQGGNAASVSSGSQDFGTAGQDIAGVADSYRASTTAQTSAWTGTSADEYRNSAAQHADGVAGLGEASNTTASAILGAGQVVAQCIAEVTQLIAEAVAEIVPIMTQAIARAGETFGQSVAEAIPPCVGIAVTYAAKIAAKIAALIASGNNLMKLVQGAMAVVDLIKAGMTTMSQQSVRPESEPQETVNAAAAGAAPETPQVRSGEQPTSSAGSSGGSGGSGGSGSAGGGVPSVGGLPNSSGSTPSLDGTRSAALAPLASTPPLASGGTAHVGGSGAATTGGGVPMAAGLAHGAHAGAGRGADSARQDGRQQPGRASGSGSTAPGGMPMAPMGARQGGDGDKEHQRKYLLSESHDEDLEYAPEVIDSRRPAN